MPRKVPLPWPQVTAAKLAAGAVSYSSLADGTVALIANKVTDTRTIVGAVTLSGLKPIARGSGFSVRHILYSSGFLVLHTHAQAQTHAHAQALAHTHTHTHTHAHTHIYTYRYTHARWAPSH